MPSITISYNNQNIKIKNNVTTSGESISEIPLNHLFVNEADSYGDQNAYDIKEIEQYVSKYHQFNNLYTIPRESFSNDDLLKLANRSKIIRDSLSLQLENNKQHIDQISPQTLIEMQLFANNVRGIKGDPRDVEVIKIQDKYSAQELQRFSEAGVNISDLIRGDAFNRFKSYYDSLSVDEKTAIDSLPEVRAELPLYGLSKFSESYDRNLCLRAN
jgi:hypothetical protein